MKNQILFLTLALGLLSFTNLHATNNPEADLRKSITEMVKEEVLQILGPNENAEVKIQFVLTSDNKIRVIGVNTDNPLVKNMVFQLLDHSSIDVNNLMTKFHYNLTIHFIHPSI
jgi:hypothetical protein